MPAGSVPPSTQHPEQVRLLYYLKNKCNELGDASSSNGDDNLAVVWFISILVYWRFCIYIALAFAHLYYRRFIRFVVYLYIHIFLSLYDFLSLYVIFFLSISLFQSWSMYPYSFLDRMYMIGVVIFARSYWLGRNISYLQSHWIFRIQVCLSFWLLISHSFSFFLSSYCCFTLSLISGYVYQSPHEFKYALKFDWLMIAFITCKSSLVPFLEGLCTSNPCRFEFSVFLSFCRNRTDDLRINSPALWPSELVLHRFGCFIVVADHLSNSLPLYAGFLFFLCIILCLILYQNPVFCQFSRIQTKKFVCIYECLSCWMHYSIYIYIQRYGHQRNVSFTTFLAHSNIITCIYTSDCSVIRHNLGVD